MSLPRIALPLAVALLVALPPARAADLAPATDATLALEYLTLTGMPQALDDMTKSYVEQIPPWVRADERERARRIVTKALDWNTNKDALAAIVTQTYTRGELEAVVNFMHTPLGASYAAKSPQFGRRYTTFLMDKVDRDMRAAAPPQPQSPYPSQPPYPSQSPPPR